jgi:hypothetical protein
MGKEEKPKSEEEKDKTSERPQQPEEIVPAEEESILPNEILEKFPPEAREVVRKSTSMFMAGAMPPPHYHIAKKMTSEHIGKVIDGIEKDSQREHQGRMSTRRWNFAWLIACLIFILALSGLFLWKEKSEYIVPIITALLGGAGGYGIGLSQGQKRAQ